MLACIVSWALRFRARALRTVLVFPLILVSPLIFAASASFGTLTACPPERPAAAAPLSLAAQPVGVATVATTMIPGSDMQREVSAIVGTGANAIRIPVNWNVIQPSADGTLRWQLIDNIVSAANRSGLRILLVLEGPAPLWAQMPGADPAATGNAPARAADFGDFAEAVARRYGRQVQMWEIWNEPNTSDYLIPPTAKAYLPLLRDGFLGIRRAGSTAPVLTGGTSSELGHTPDIDFIKALYSMGAAPYFDGVAVHPYSFPEPVDFECGRGAIVSEARKVMIEHGDASKKIWITEFGQPTGPTTVSTDEQVQANIIVDAIDKSRRTSWIGAFFVFTTEDLAANSTDPDDNCGLYHYDFTPKDAVSAMRLAVAE